MKYFIVIFLLITISSCSENIINQVDKSIIKKESSTVEEIKIKNCIITFKTVEGDLLELNFLDNKCNDGSKNIISKAIEYNLETGNYNESKIKLDNYNLIIKQDKMLYSSFGANEDSIAKDEIDFNDGHKMYLELSEIYNFDVLSLSEKEIKDKTKPENIEYYVLKANLGNINILGEISRDKTNNIKNIFNDFKEKLKNTKIVKEEIVDSTFLGETISIKTNFGEYTKKIKIVNYSYDGRDAYNFATVDGICLPSTSNRGCKIDKFENNEMFWGNELIDRNTGEEILIKVNLKTNLLTGETYLLN